MENGAEPRIEYTHYGVLTGIGLVFAALVRALMLFTERFVIVLILLFTILLKVKYTAASAVLCHEYAWSLRFRAEAGCLPKAGKSSKYLRPG